MQVCSVLRTHGHDFHTVPYSSHYNYKVFQWSYKKWRTLNIINEWVDLMICWTASPSIQISWPPLPFSQMCIDCVCPLEGRNPVCAELSHGHLPTQLPPSFSVNASLSFLLLRVMQEKRRWRTLIKRKSPWVILPSVGQPCRKHGLD